MNWTNYTTRLASKVNNVLSEEEKKHHETIKKVVHAETDRRFNENLNTYKNLKNSRNKKNSNNNQNKMNNKNKLSKNQKAGAKTQASKAKNGPLKNTNFFNNQQHFTNIQQNVSKNKNLRNRVSKNFQKKYQINKDPEESTPKETVGSKRNLKRNVPPKKKTKKFPKNKSRR